MNPYMKSSMGNALAVKEVAPNSRSGSTTTNKPHLKRVNSGQGNSYGTPRKPRNTKPKKRSGLSQMSIAPAKLIFWSLVAGICGFIYINHVFTTQQLLQEVNLVQREFERVQIIHEDRSLTHDRLTGPAEVFSRARALGYQDSGPADHIIIIGE